MIPCPQCSGTPGQLFVREGGLRYARRCPVCRGKLHIPTPGDDDELDRWNAMNAAEDNAICQNIDAATRQKANDPCPDM